MSEERQRGEGAGGEPPRRYLDAEHVLDVMAHKAAERIAGLTAPQIFVLAAVAGGFITVGALFSVLLGAQVEAAGPQGTAGAWFEVVLSGVLANWLVGMAAFFAVMGRTILGVYVPVLLAVSLFVAANFQHSPANMGFFSLIMPSGDGPGWGDALVWNVIPAGIGNMIGGTFLVVLPFWYALQPHQRRAMRAADTSS